MREKKEKIKQRIDSGLEIGAFDLAVKLAQDGKRLYPHDEEMQKIGRVLAPPEATVVEWGPNPKIERCMEWIETHRKEYLGRWVALRNGELLGSGGTWIEALGEHRSAEVNVLTKVF